MVELEDIRLYNPQLEGDFFEVPETKRDKFDELLMLTGKPQIVSLVGMRRVGKTTLIKQVLNKLVTEGKSVFYFSFDELRYANVDSLNQVIKWALKLFDKPVIALDEIGRVPGWSGVIKKYYDHKKLKFIISGSESLEITKGKESLAGRVYDLYLPPLQYPEYLNLSGVQPPGLVLDLNNPETAFVRWREQDVYSFLFNGGFPEIVNETDKNIVKRYILSSSIEKIVFEDLPKTFDITNEQALYQLMQLVSRQPGMILVASSLEKDLKISRETILRYLFYLEQAFLVKTIHREGSVLAAARKSNKVYPSSASISSAFLSYTPEDIKKTNAGQIAETAVLDKISNGFGKGPCFYRDNRKREVDFITDVPIEVKFKETVKRGDLSSILYYMKKKNKDKGIIVTKNLAEAVEYKGKQLVLVPLDLFLQLKEIKQ